MPANLSLVIATRSDPPLPLARLRAGGHLLEIRADDLRFAEGEASRMLNDALGLGLAAEGIKLLCQRTEGWAAGLYLAALSLEGRSDADSYIRAFAVRTGISSTTSVPRCLTASRPGDSPLFVADGCPGAAECAAVRRCPGHLGIGGHTGGDRARQPVSDAAGFVAPLVPVPPFVRRSAAQRATARRARPDSEAGPTGGSVVPGRGPHRRSGAPPDRRRSGRRRAGHQPLGRGVQPGLAVHRFGLAGSVAGADRGQPSPALPGPGLDRPRQAAAARRGAGSRLPKPG